MQSSIAVHDPSGSNTMASGSPGGPYAGPNYHTMKSNSGSALIGTNSLNTNTTNMPGNSLISQGTTSNASGNNGVPNLGLFADDNSLAQGRARLHELFGLIEREYDALLEENNALRARLGMPLIPTSAVSFRHSLNYQTALSLRSHFPLTPTATTSSSATSTSVPSTPSAHITWAVAREYTGHRDGIWEVTSCPGCAPLNGTDDVFATASVDRSVRVWSSGANGCIFVYYGHKGSVNSVREGRDKLFCTASGDRTCHLFKLNSAAVAAAASSTTTSTGVQGSGIGGNNYIASPGRPFDDDGFDDDTDGSDIDDDQKGTTMQARGLTPAACYYQKVPLLELKGHRGVVIGADWLCGPAEGGEQIVSASWDNTVRLWSASTGEQVTEVSAVDKVSTAQAAEQRVRPTNVAVHPKQPLALVSFSDGAFRLWDVRAQHSVMQSVQAHSNEGCLSAVCDPDGDFIVTTGVDRHIKVYDMRAMGKSSRLDLRGNIAIGRPTVTSSHLLVVPQDKGGYITDFNGKKLGKIRIRHSNCLIMGYTWSRNEKAIITATFHGNVMILGQVAPILTSSKE